MKERLLLDSEGCKDIAIFDDPERLRPLLNRLSWQILRLLGEGEMYPLEIARKLGAHEQKVYYHIRRLAEAGLIRVVREEERQGATAKYYRATFPSFGVELPFGRRAFRRVSLPSVDERTERFLRPYVGDGRFDGKIVVGSPDPHGPFRARARDGHYASYLALFLGRFVELPEDFVVRLDVDVKAEKDEGNNLILVGGPGTNLLTQEVNEHLPIRFNMMPSKHGFLLGGLVSEGTGRVYTGDSVGLIARIVNPWNRGKVVTVLAGNKAVGTKSCVIALTRFWAETLKNFEGQERFATVVQGFDLDGDGKIDSIDVLE